MDEVEEEVAEGIVEIRLQEDTHRRNEARPNPLAIASASCRWIVSN
jgi:hypothetical protein